MLEVIEEHCLELEMIFNNGVAYVIVGLSALWQLMPMVSSFTEGEIAAERHIRHQ